MNYQETLDWLFKQLPMYQRDGKSAYKADLSNTHALMELLHHPENKFKSIHIGGTNGKGSVSHMLASIFQSAGYKTGLYTSPHLSDFRERIRINGTLIPEKEVIQFVKTYRPHFESLKLSFFEMTVGLAFDFFAKEKVDIAIIEVGMGGRLDSTNVITPELSIITNISLDHTAFLGNTKAKIAAEKAGIIKQNVSILIGEIDKETKNVFRTIAKEKMAQLEFAKWDGQLPECDLKGSYQKLNLTTVVSAVKILDKKGYSLSNHISALKEVGRSTGLRGRWQKLQEQPMVICDTGHNQAGLSLILKQLKEEKYKRLRIVWGMVNDKEVRNILSILPSHASYYICEANIPRAMPAEVLYSYFKDKRPELETQLHNSVASAYKKALEDACPEDLIFVGGSTFVVAEIL